MIVLGSLESAPPLPHPIALGVGTFDGVHLGHLSLIRALREAAGPTGTVALISFYPHPSHTLTPSSPTPHITTKRRKERLLEEAGVNFLYHIPFTLGLSQLPYDSFLRDLHALLPFSHLIRGAGSCLGRERGGTPEAVQALAPLIGFTATYLPILHSARSLISSRTIRQKISSGHVQEAEALLGHPFYLEGSVTEEGRFLPSGDLPLLPALGTYPVQIGNGEEVREAELFITSKGMLLEGILPEKKEALTLRFL